MKRKEGTKLFDALAALFMTKDAAGAAAPEEEYEAYLALTEPDEAELAAQRDYTPSDPPRFIVSVTQNGTKHAAETTVASLNAQTYPHYELTQEPFEAVGDYVIVLEAGDALSPDALYHFAKAVERARETKLIYANEDVMTPMGRAEPILKGDYDEVSALSFDLFGTPFAVDKAIFDICAAPGMLRSQDAADRYAYALRCLARAGGAMHIDRVLCTRAQRAAPIPCGAGCDAVNWYLRKTGQDCTVSAGLWQGSFRVNAMTRRSRTAIIIPNKDGPQELRRLLESIEETCAFYEPEIVIADAHSTVERTKRYYDILRKSGAVKLVRLEEGAGFSRLCNEAAKRANADELFFLSRDAVLSSPDVIGALRAQANRRRAGAVGCMLKDGVGRLLHAGYMVGFGKNIASPYAGDNAPERGCARKLRFTATVRGVSAVSGAAMYMRSDVFHSAGGFDESFDEGNILPCGADAELCVRLMRRGLTNIYTPYAGVSYYGDLLQIENAGEKTRMRAYDALRPMIVDGDPYVSGGYTRRSLSMRVKTQREDDPPDAF